MLFPCPTPTVFRCVILVDAVTMTVFNYVRRGLFERDKLTVATMLTLKILVNDGILAQEEVDYLVMSKVSKISRSRGEGGEYRSPYFFRQVSHRSRFREGGDYSSATWSHYCFTPNSQLRQASMDPGNMGPLGEWLPETIWPKLKSLERIKRFQNIGDAMQSDSDDWQVKILPEQTETQLRAVIEL